MNLLVLLLWCEKSFLKARLFRKALNLTAQHLKCETGWFCTKNEVFFPQSAQSANKNKRQSYIMLGWGRGVRENRIHIHGIRDSFEKYPDCIF